MSDRVSDRMSLRVAFVADRAIPAEGWSRDPRTLAAGLRDLGHEVTEVPVTDRPGASGTELSPSPAEVPADLGEDLAAVARAQVVVTAGLAAPAVGAVLAGSLGVPLAGWLPVELFGQHPPTAGYARLICRHLPYALLFAESLRQAAAAQRHGADPHRTVVVPPGLCSGDFAAPPRRRGQSAGEPRLLLDVTRTPLDDQSFLDEVLTRLAARRASVFHTVVLGVGATVVGRWCGRAATTVVELPSWAGAAQVYASVDVVLVPAAEPDQTAVLLRAMAAGRALVAADGPAAHDTVSTARHGILARAGATDEWVDKLDYLLDTPALRLHIGRNARIRAENQFSLDQTLHRLETRLRALTQLWGYAADPHSGP